VSYLYYFVTAEKQIAFNTVQYSRLTCILQNVSEKSKNNNNITNDDGACGSGTQLATTSGDTTVKIWDFANAICIQTFADHQKAGKYIFSLFSYQCYVVAKC